MCMLEGDICDCITEFPFPVIPFQEQPPAPPVMQDRTMHPQVLLVYEQMITTRNYVYLLRFLCIYLLWSHRSLFLLGVSF